MEGAFAIPENDQVVLDEILAEIERGRGLVLQRPEFLLGGLAIVQPEMIAGLQNILVERKVALFSLYVAAP